MDQFHPLSLPRPPSVGDALKQRRRCLRQSLVRDAVVTAARLLGWGLGPTDHHAAPDSLPTLTYYSKIGELCGAQPDLERLEAHVISTWLCSRWPTARRTSRSLTCASHSRSARSLRRGTTAGSPPSPSTSASLEPLLSSRRPGSLRLPQCAPTSRNTNGFVRPLARRLAWRAWPGCAKALIRASSPSHRRVRGSSSPR